MFYSEITVYTTSECAELVAYFLQEVCMDGVSIYDKNDFDSASWDYKDVGAELVYDDEVKVKGYCKQEDTDRVLCFLRQNMQNVPDCGSLRTEINVVEEDSWVAPWKATFRPIETEKLVICPEWLSVETQKKVLMLDTGIAFGTGQHETTSMCIDFAEEMDLSGKTVLDVGCGSGILGLSAILLGAESACLVDLDEQAVNAAVHNARLNGMENSCSVLHGNLTEKVNGSFDVIFANLTADILALLVNDISKVTKKGTVIILSGILDVKLDFVKKLYSSFRIIGEKAKGEWRSLMLTNG